MALSSSSPNMYDETQLQYPEWQGPLHDALLELDMATVCRPGSRSRRPL